MTTSNCGNCGTSTDNEPLILCDDCDTWPSNIAAENATLRADVTRLNAELEQLKDKGAEAVDAFAEREREQNARIAELTAERDTEKEFGNRLLRLLLKASDLLGVSMPDDFRNAVDDALDGRNPEASEIEKYRADFARDQAELASLRIELAALKAERASLTEQRDQCHLRAQTAELRNESLVKELEDAKEALWKR